MNTPNQINSQVGSANLPPDQLSPNEVIARAKKFQYIAKRNWKIAVALIIISGAIGYWIDKSSTKKTVYVGKIVFNLGGGSGSSQMADLGALASAFGLGQAAPEANLFTGENFMLYTKSVPVIEKTLMKTVVINKKPTLLVNYYIEHSGILDKEWEKNEPLRRFRFKQAKKREDYNELEIAAMAGIHGRLVDELYIKPLERKSSFMALNAAMENVALAKTFVETHIVTIEDDYRLKQTKKTQEMQKFLEHRVDSLFRRLSGTEDQLASYINQNQQVVVAEGQLRQARLNRTSGFLNQQYYTAVTSLDNLKLSLIREQPLFTIIEPVILPLYSTTPPKIAMQAGFAIGLVLSIVIIFIRETLRKSAMTN
ncbi:hypothetical protein [Fibrella forsythiae]|uniref:Lipopolysaccharide biosynthesis protein n=1 Tax=Fibrella forsythiae TaxID=2817061 RepID=A0ABS3JQZ4_9BACT|nr:hypothetical protein [Fibrella forsythiae]MBO0952425.1 hypothetical protein [Fibrella forsythiae]